MDVSRRCDYACRIMRAVSKRPGDYVSMSEVAEEENIPYAFTRSIQHDLTRAGFLKTTRGVSGGATLSCDLSQVSLLEFLEKLQIRTSMSKCSNDPGFCTNHTNCSFHRVWRGADRLLKLYFASISLSDVLEQDGEMPFINGALDLTVARMHEMLGEASLTPDDEYVAKKHGLDLF